MSESALDEAYRAALSGEVTGSFDRGAKGAYMYELAKKADAIAAVGSRARQKRIMKELKALQAPDRLPCAAKASIFVRTDEERIDVVRPAATAAPPAGERTAHRMLAMPRLVASARHALSACGTDLSLPCVAVWDV